jgi:hypothetical protein
MNLSPCGIKCGEFEACKSANCGGCHAIKGKPFYLKDFGVEVCPIYDCAVNKKGYHTCGECEQLPCEIIYGWKDPSSSDEEHAQSIKHNAALLKEYAKKG